ncbi:MAG: hypothetical protein J7518_16530 [Nocardioidaceae bacterium]|nr:hypothetical protein [Nocardioidaceae bacterium]
MTTNLPNSAVCRCDALGYSADAACPWLVCSNSPQAPDPGASQAGLGTDSAAPEPRVATSGSGPLLLDVNDLPESNVELDVYITNLADAIADAFVISVSRSPYFQPNPSLNLARYLAGYRLEALRERERRLAE